MIIIVKNLKQNKENCNIIKNYSTKTPLTHIETSQLTCTASKLTDFYIRQYHQNKFSKTLYIHTM